ncbi:hypothetical protein [Turicibacter sp.]|uniref:hypothetical protein n=1 Tax=Turicibacter sp. TaxID=2049042 RepID=UPI001B4F9058|nr:hypothetical protein [Turicibacter sp.]MBP3903571.1 hypothetical protein [Turicibacter sp.]MBP3908086.1 hypothetical protein [Turicibacter sp.]
MPDRVVFKEEKIKWWEFIYFLFKKKDEKDMIEIFYRLIGNASTEIYEKQLKKFYKSLSYEDQLFYAIDENGLSLFFEDFQNELDKWDYLCSSIRYNVKK